MGVRDVVVIGSGHNALVGACYLAAAGLDVEVIERDSVLGGAVSTVERFPGYQVDRGSSLHIMVRHTGIVEELDLAREGLEYIDLDPWAFHPIAGAPGGGITFWASVERTCASIEAVCGGRDARAYGLFAAEWGRRNQQVFAAFHGPPTGRILGRALWQIGRGSGLPGIEVGRQFLTSGDALLDSLFDSEHLKTALAWLGAQSGPPMHEAATADLVGWNTVLHQLPPGRPRGGSGALTQALAARLRRSGGRLRLADGAVKITGTGRPGTGRPGAGGPSTRRPGTGGLATGVLTASGEHIRARAVLAGCHVLTTVALAEALLPPDLSERCRRTIRLGDGVGMAVRLAGTGLPRYPGADPAACQGMQLVTGSRAELRSAYADYLSGRSPARPAALVMTPSAVDPSLAPAGRYTTTIWGQWHRYDVAGGWRPERAADAAERLLAVVEDAAPGFRDTVEQVYVQTPADLEAELGLLRGNIMHVDMTLDSMFSWRPLPELSGYRTPVPGLYLCGASTHPGGGVSGASGRSAARILLADLRRRR